MELKKFYVSLVRGLVGYYVLFEAPDRNLVRCYCARYFGRMWCAVYDSIPEIDTDAKVVNPDKPIILTLAEDEIWD